MNSPLSNAHIGSLFVVVAPSGAGKSSLVNELLKSDDNILLSVSHTTRAPRVGEVDGVAYHFTTVDDFLAKRDAGGFIESAEVHGNYYGTSKDWIVSALTSGKDVLLEIDWQGAQQVRTHFPDMIGIFILPPSMEALNERLHKRGTDTEEVIARRLAAAKMKWRTQVSVNMLSLTTYFPPLWRNCSRLLARHDCGLPRKRHVIPIFLKI